MPRQIRVEYAGAIYHVMSRGDRRDDIYLDDVDRREFLKTMAEAFRSRSSLFKVVNLFSPESELERVFRNISEVLIKTPGQEPTICTLS